MSAYLKLREAWVAQRRLVIDGGATAPPQPLRTLIADPAAVLERHRRDVRAGSDVLTTATWGPEAAAWISREPETWRAVAARGVKLARLAIAAQHRTGDVAVGFSIDAAGDGGMTADWLARVFEDTRPDFVLVRSPTPQQPALEPLYRRLEFRLPVWLSLPRAPETSIDWLERRGRRTRVIDGGLLEITRW